MSAMCSAASRFSNRNPHGQRRFLPSLLELDPPDHNRLRRMLNSRFTAKRMQRLAPRIAAIITDSLDAMERQGPPADLIADFALPIPALVICELLGVPGADRADLQRLSALRKDLTNPAEERIAYTNESQSYMAELVARKRADPDDQMISTLIREHGDELTNDELVSIADLLLIAGHETTSSMLSLGTLLLLQHPNEAVRLRDDDIVDQTIEELLRYLSVVTHALPRYGCEKPSYTASSSGPGMSCSAHSRWPTATHGSLWTWNHSTSTARPLTTWPSAMASTTAWAHHWPAWKCAPPSLNRRRGRLLGVRARHPDGNLLVVVDA